MRPEGPGFSRQDFWAGPEARVGTFWLWLTIASWVKNLSQDIVNTQKILWISENDIANNTKQNHLSHLGSLHQGVLVSRCWQL